MKSFGNFFIWVITIVLFIINSLIISSYNILCFIYGDRDTAQAMITNKILWLVLSIAFAIIFIGAINRNRNWNVFFKISRVMLSIIMLLSLLFFLRDDQPLEGDYSRNDIQFDQIINFDSYAILKNLYKNEDANGAIGETGFEDVLLNNSYNQHSDAILKSWENIRSIRGVIKELDRFSSFCHLHPDAKFDFDMPALDYKLLRVVSDIYSAYSALMVEQGKLNEGIMQLCQLHRVAKKGLSSADTLVNKMVWLLVVDKTIRAAYEIIKNNHQKKEVCRALKNDFKPLAPDEISLRNVFIVEYLVSKAYCHNRIKAPVFIDWLTFDEGEERSSGLSRQLLSCIVYYLSFKKNMTNRDIRKFWDIYITGVQSNPPDVSAARTYISNYMKNPQIRNMAGWLFVVISTPNFEGYVKRISEKKVLSDMLAISIYGYLDMQLDIMDFYTGKPYELIHNGVALSHAGEDGISGTKDDIEFGKD